MHQLVDSLQHACLPVAGLRSGASGGFQTGAGPRQLADTDATIAAAVLRSRGDLGWRCKWYYLAW